MYVLLAVKEVVVDHKFHYGNKIRVVDLKSFFFGSLGEVEEFNKYYSDISDKIESQYLVKINNKSVWFDEAQLVEESIWNAQENICGS